MLLILFLVVLTVFLYVKVVKPYAYWIKKGVKQRKQIYLLGDNAGVMLRRESFFDSFIAMYNAFPEERYMGIYQMTLPTLIFRDPELIKQITVKEFDHFLDHRGFTPEGVDPIWSRNLFALKGLQWRHMRTTLSPSFTSSKMKIMFSLISECANEYLKYFQKDDEIKTVELKDIFTRYTNDVIATVAFGIKCDSINNRNNEFYAMGKDLTTFTFWRNMRFFANTLMPGLSRLLGVKLFPTRVTAFFQDLVLESIKIREEQGIVRPDMLNLLLEARKGKKRFEEVPTLDAGFATVEEALNAEQQQKFEITDIDMAAQALIFFFAGFESVAVGMSFMGYELAVNPDIQKRLQEEVDETIKECPNGKLTYEALMGMKYLDMVVSESLRKWPPAVGTDRVCTKPFTIEPTKPHEVPVVLQPGDVVWIPINAIHRDSQYYSNPDKFDPERFSDENKHLVQPYTYLPFGLGPRNCIGSRFALLELKCIYFCLLRNFDLVAVEKTDIPLKIDKKTFNLTAENGMWLGLKPRRVNKSNGKINN